MTTVHEEENAKKNSKNSTRQRHLSRRLQLPCLLHPRKSEVAFVRKKREEISYTARGFEWESSGQEWPDEALASG